MTDPKKKEDPVLKGLGTVDQALFDAQAKTIDVVDNVFLICEGWETGARRRA